MIDLSKWGLANKRLVFLLVVILTLGGFVSYFRMPKLEDPEIAVRQAVVVGIYPGASAHQVELELTIPMENSIRQGNGILYTNSYSYADMCFIMVTQDTKVGKDQLQTNWMTMRNYLADVQLPVGSHVEVHDDFGSVSGLFYALKGNGVEPERMEAFAQMIQRELQKLDGVKHVNIYGIQHQCVNIRLHQDKLANLGVVPAEVIATLKEQDATVYSGYFQSGDHRIRVSVNDRYDAIEDIRNLILRGRGGDKFRLGDIADVTMEPEPLQRNEMLRDGEQALGLCIAPASGADVIKVGKRVEKCISELQSTRLPASVECEKVFFQSDCVQNAMHTFIINLVESVLLVIVLLMLCMNFRSGLILGITLIVTVLGSILVLNYMDGTLQRVSLGSFILAMGMLVDNAIVIIDGILVDKKAGIPRMEALTAIGRKTALPLLCATLIAILAFMPISLSPDVTGLYVRDMFIVLSVSLLLSWLLALVLVPILASWWIYRDDATPQPSALSPQPSALSPQPSALNHQAKAYRLHARVLRWSMGHRWFVVGVMAVLLVAVAFTFPLMPRVLFPDMEYEQLYMEYKLPDNCGPDRVKADLEEIRKELMQMDDVVHVTTSIGGSPSRYNLVRSVALPLLSYGELIIDFRSIRSLDRHVAELQRHFSAKYPDAFLVFKRYNLMFMPYPVELRFCGPDPAVLHQLADSALAINKRLGIINPVTTDWAPRVPMLVVDYDQARAREHGISRSEASFSLLSATDGLPVGCYYDGTMGHNIYLSLTDQQGQPLTQLSNATVFGLLPQFDKLAKNVDATQLLLTPGQLDLRLPHTAQLSEIGDNVHIAWEDPVIPHYNGERIHSIKGYPAEGYITEDARQALEREISKWTLPDGYSFQWGGEKYASDLSIQYLFAPYPLVFLIMLSLLVGITRRFRTSLLLICSIPFVFVGIIPSILFTGMTFNFVSLVGALGLVGMVLKNGIVLVDEIQLQQSNSQHPVEAVISASVSRLRPVTLASLTTVLGMVPLLFDDMFSSMASTIIGGLIAGTVIVLIFIPVLYAMFFKLKE